MKSTPRTKRATRQVVLTAESLEGRQLLSTVAATTDTTTMASAPLGGLQGHHGHLARFSLHRGGPRHSFTTSSMATLSSDAVPAVSTPADAIANPSSVGGWRAPRSFGQGHFGGRMALNSLPRSLIATTQTVTSAVTTPASSTASVATTTSTSMLPVQVGVAAAQATSASGNPQVDSGGPMGGGGWRDFGGMAARGQSGDFTPNGPTNGGTPAGSEGHSSTTPAPTQAQVAAFTQLTTDAQAIHDKSTVTPVMLAAVRNDFTAIEKDATTAPDATKLSALQADLKANAGAIPTDVQKAQTQADFKAVVLSEGVTDTALIDKTIADTNVIVVASNVNADDLAKLAADRTAAGLPAGTGMPTGPGLDLGGGMNMGGHRGMRMSFGGGDPSGMPPGGMMAPPVNPPATTPTTTPVVTTPAPTGA